MSACNKCGGIEFYKNKRCKSCQRRYARNAYYLDPEKSKARAQTWKRSNRAAARVSGRKGGRLDWLPGEHEKAEAKLAIALVCDVCLGADPHHKRGWNADHDHKTGKFRGIICHPCNIAISHVEKFGMDRGQQIANYLALSISI